MRTSKFLGTAATAAIATTFLAATPAMAQDGGEAAEEGTGVGTIIVTAQRREENIQDVPISVTAVSQDQLTALNGGGQDIRALSGKVPSLLVESSFGRTFPRFYIRGLGNTDFDFNADQWSSKLTTKLKLPAGIDFEVTGQYQSAEQSVQSRQSDQLFADLGLRKKILNGKGVLNISVRDVFASRIGESITDQSGFYLYSRRQRGRFVTLGFSYGFGKGEAMEFSGARRRH